MSWKTQYVAYVSKKNTINEKVAYLFQRFILIS